MMKEKTIPKKLKGTVLFTVVSVMMVLIVFLMATLALAMTASNRAYSNYQKVQAQATARAVLDATIQVIDKDASTSGFKSQLAGLSTGASIEMTVNIDGTDESVTATNIGTRSYYDEEAAKWIEGNFYELSTTVSKNLADTTYSAYVIASYTEGKKVTSPPAKGGAFVSTGGLGSQIGTQGYVAGGVEVLEWGDYTIENTAEIQMPLYINGNLSISTSAGFEFTSLGDYFVVTGDLSNSNNPVFKYADELKTAWADLQASGTPTAYNVVPYIYVGGTLKGSEDNLWQFNTVDDVAINVYANQIQLNNFGGFYGDLYAFGEDSSNFIGKNKGSASELYNWSERTIQNKDESTSNNLWGNYYAQGETTFSISAASMTIDGDCRVDNDVTVTGGQTLTVKGDLVCDTLVVDSGTTLSVEGNVYCDTLTLNGTLNMNGNDVHANDLYGNGTIQNIGTLYYASAGAETTINTTYANVNITKELVSERENSWSANYWHYTYTADKTVEVIVDGVVTSTNTENISGTSGTIEIYTWSYNDSYDEYLASGADDLYNTLMSGSTSETRSQFNLDSVANKIQTTAQSVDVLYGQEIYPQDYTAENLKSDVLPTVDSSTYADYPTTLDELNGNIPIYTQDENGDYTTTIIFPEYDATVGATDNCNGPITTSCRITSNSHIDSNKNIYINPSSSDSIVILIENSLSLSNGASIIINDNQGTVYFFIEDGQGIYLSQGCLTTTDYMKLFTGTTYSDADVMALSKGSISAMITNMASELTVHQVVSAGSDYYPNVVIYGGTGTYITLSDNSSAFITANIRAPQTDFSQSASNHNANKTVTYIKSDEVTGSAISTQTEYVHLIGQLIAHKITVSNQWGMLFVTLPESSNNSNDDDDGAINEGEAAGLPKAFIPVYYNVY